MVHEYICIKWCTDCSHCTKFGCRKFFELSIKLFKVRMRANKVLITFVAVNFFVKVLLDIFTAFITLEFGMLV